MEENKKKEIFSISIIILFTFLVYFNSLFNPFIWDDISLIVENTFIRNLKISLLSFTKDIYTGFSKFYRPLQIISYAFVYKIFKLKPIGYHLLNIFFHSGCGVLIYFLLKNIYGKKISFLTGLLWAIHPVNTEAITYISGTADPSFLFFGLLGIYFYNISTDYSYFSKKEKNNIQITDLSFEKRKKRKKHLFFTLSLLCFIFSLISKETAVLFLPLFFLYLYSTDKFEKQNFKDYFIVIFIFLIYLIFRQIFLNHSDKTFTEVNLISRFFTGFETFLIYVSILIFPFFLNIERHIPYIKTPNPDFFAGLFFFLLSFYLLSINKKNKKIFFAGSLFLINWLFHSNIIFQVNGNLREHWMYLGSIGFFIYFVIILDKIKKEKLKTFLLVLIFSFYGIRTILRNYDWKNPEIFYIKSINHSFYPSLLYGNLSYFYLRNGEFEKSCEVAEKAISMGIKNETILYIYAVSLLNIKKYNEAEKVFKELLRTDKENYEVLTELGDLYYSTGNIEKAEEFLEKSIKINPYNPKAYYILTEIYRIQGKKEKVLNSLEILTKLVPDDFYPYYLKGMLFKEIKNYKIADENFQKAYLILKNKTDFLSLFNIGIICIEMGKIDEALDVFLKLNSMKPENVEVMNEIAVCYAMKGEKKKAKEIWEKILLKNPDYYPAIENLKKLKF